MFMSSNVREARLMMSKVEFKQGPGYKNENLETALMVLNKVVRLIGHENHLLVDELGVITIKKPPWHQKIKDLKELGYLDIHTREGRGNPWDKILILKEEFEQATKPPAPPAKAVPQKCVRRRKPGHTLVPVTKENQKAKKGDKQLRAHLFIDVPNLANEKKITLARIDWQKLWKALIHHKGKCLDIVNALAFATLPEDQPDEKEWSVYKKLEGAGFEPRVRKGWCYDGQYVVKDIDTWLATDMTKALTNEINNGGGKAVVILLAGDSDYTYTLQTLKSDAIKVKKSLYIKIFAWQKSLSSELQKIADEVEYIEDIIHLIDYNYNGEGYI